MKHDNSTLKAAIDRNVAKINNAILKQTAHDELSNQRISYRRMSFFVIAEVSLYNDMLAHAIKVLDDHKDALSLWYIIRCNEAVADKAAKHCKINFVEINELSEKLKFIRNKSHFHIDRGAVKQRMKVWEEADISGERFVASLNSIACLLFNTKKDLFGGEREKITPYDGSDVPNIIKAYEAAYGSVHGV